MKRWGSTLWRRALQAALMLAACALLTTPQPADAGPRKGGYIVVDMETGAVLDAVRSKKKASPASLTKMMTLYLAFEALSDGRLTWDQELPVSARAASAPPVKLGLRRGDRITVGEAVIATAVRSANDAAVVLAEAVGGSERKFARMMTAKARMFGMNDTVFRTASGLDADGHLSTPRDMAVLARRLFMDFPDYYSILGKPSFKYKRRRYRATNTLLGRGGVDGMKTGYTRLAGYNLAASAEREGARVLVVLMGGRSRPRRDKAVLRLLDEGFDRLARAKKKDQLITLDQLPSTGETAVAGGAPIVAPAPSPRPPKERSRPAPPPRDYDPDGVATSSIPVDPAAMAAEVAETLARRDGDLTEIGEGDATPAQAPGWAVQIGAFREPSRAEALMRTVMKDMSAEIAGAYQSIQPTEVVTDNGKLVLHRVRFSGMERAAAALLCDKIAVSGAPCAVVPPQDWR